MLIYLQEPKGQVGHFKIRLEVLELEHDVLGVLGVLRLEGHDCGLVELVV